MKGETQLRNLSSKLAEAGIKHKLWIEQPEDYATCLATKPYRKSEVAQLFKKARFLRGELPGLMFLARASWTALGGTALHPLLFHCTFSSFPCSDP